MPTPSRRTPKQPPSPPPRPWWADWIFEKLVVVVGAAGVLWETVHYRAERPFLLGVFVACMGLPGFVAIDRRRRRDEDGEP